MGKQMERDEAVHATVRRLRNMIEHKYVGGGKSSREIVIPVLFYGGGHHSSIESALLPDFSDYMRLIDEAIEREKLSTDDRVIARAFAIAVYRRALANRLMSDVKILASEAIQAVMERLGEEKGRKVKRVTYDYGSTRIERISRRSSNEGPKRAGEGG